VLPRKSLSLSPLFCIYLLFSPDLTPNDPASLSLFSSLFSLLLNYFAEKINKTKKEEKKEEKKEVEKEASDEDMGFGLFD